MLSIFDLINKDIDYRREYNKIRTMFLDDYVIDGSMNNMYNYSEVFDAYIMKWKYRGTKCSLGEIINEIEEKTNCGNDAVLDCLYLCELILNIREFLIYLKENFYTNYGLYFSDINDKMLIGNVHYILNSLGYSICKEEEYKVRIIKNNTDSISTALIVENVEVQTLIMQYNDFKIVNNIKEKQKLIYGLSNFLEPKRKKLREKNKDLEKYLFMAFNKMNIRHNNIDGEKKEEYTSRLSENELLQWYDRIYNLTLISIRLLELDNQIKPFEDVAKEYFDNK